MTYDWKSSERKSGLIFQDVSKLHSEINQAVNHRFLLTAGAITAFALIFRYMLYVPSSENTEKGKEVISVATIDFTTNIASYSAYLAVLALLFYQSIGIRVIIRTNSTYLRAKNYSDWENDWHKFRSRDKSKTRIFRGVLSNADLIAHGSIFIGLSLLSLAVGFYLMYELCESKEFLEYTKVLKHTFAMICMAGFVYLALHCLQQPYINVVFSAVYLLFCICNFTTLIDFVKIVNISFFHFLISSMYLNIWLILWFTLRVFKPAYDETELLNVWRDILR